MLGCSGQANQSNESTEPVISSDGILVCSQVASSTPGAPPLTEWYSVTAMNNKLRHFPEFAATTGLDSVSNCAEARQLYARYVEYSNVVPRFDDDEPLEMPPLKRFLPPLATRNMPAEIVAADDRADEEVEKLDRGHADLLLPVVRIANLTESCSGTFISRNYIATAGHCLDVASVAGKDPYDFQLGVDDESAALLARFRRYDITWATTNGAAKKPITFKNVMQYKDPRYLGFQPPTPAGDPPDPTHETTYLINFDFALLWVYDANDNKLPNNVPDFLDNTFPFIRLSLRHQTDNVTSTAWGWGPREPTNSSNPDNNILHRGDLTNYALAPVDQPVKRYDTNGNLKDVVAQRIDGRVPTAPAVADVFLCHGDSGGPITDRYNIVGPNGDIAARFVEVAELERGKTKTPDCDRVQGDPVAWIRTDGERQFIANTVKLWNYFPCNAKKSADAGSEPDYLECWGQACKETADCPQGTGCVHPGSQLKECGDACQSAGEAFDGCNCIYGQCLPPSSDGG
jgi:hypothetical protein